MKSFGKYPIFLRKDYIIFCRPTPGSLKNGHAPQKCFFSFILKNIGFFQKNCLTKNIQNLSAYKKGYIEFCLPDAPFPQNGHILPQMAFRCSPKILLFSKNLFNNKISGT